MYKAVFIDIDGTLIKSDHTISEATFDVIQKLKQKNILVILVSARPLPAVLPIINKTGLTNYPVASLNGAYIVIEGKILFESTIDVTTVATLHQQLQKYDATIIYYEQAQWFSERKDYHTDYEQKITEIPITIRPFAETLQTWQDKNAGPNKVHVIGKAALVNEIQDHLQQQFAGHLSISTSKSTYLEVMHITASKLNALKILIGHYNIKQEETIAIGDNFNDKEMIEFAGIGIAMGNAPAAVKAAADYVTDTNNNDGVCKAILKFIDF
ncbi:MAG: Cof-type HAD-IIB family hydrolase [Ginsengibacter sp.]